MYDAGGVLTSCSTSKSFCKLDARVPQGCPLTCGVCVPEGAAAEEGAVAEAPPEVLTCLRLWLLACGCQCCMDVRLASYAESG